MVLLSTLVSTLVCFHYAATLGQDSSPDAGRGKYEEHQGPLALQDIPKDVLEAYARACPDYRRYATIKQYAA